MLVKDEDVASEDHDTRRTGVIVSENYGMQRDESFEQDKAQYYATRASQARSADVASSGAAGAACVIPPSPASPRMHAVEVSHEPGSMTPGAGSVGGNLAARRGDHQDEPLGAGQVLSASVPPQGQANATPWMAAIAIHVGSGDPKWL